MNRSRRGYTTAPWFEAVTLSSSATRAFSNPNGVPIKCYNGEGGVHRSDPVLLNYDPFTSVLHRNKSHPVDSTRVVCEPWQKARQQYLSMYTSPHLTRRKNPGTQEKKHQAPRYAWFCAKGCHAAIQDRVAGEYWNNWRHSMLHGRSKALFLWLPLLSSRCIHSLSSKRTNGSAAWVTGEGDIQQITLP